MAFSLMNINEANFFGHFVTMALFNPAAQSAAPLMAINAPARRRRTLLT
jgi:hypothetical protein